MFENHFSAMIFARSNTLLLPSSEVVITVVPSLKTPREN